MPDTLKTSSDNEHPSYEVFLEKNKPLLKAIVNKHHLRLSRSYSDSFYDDLYQEGLITLWKLYKKIQSGGFDGHEKDISVTEKYIVIKALDWRLSTCASKIRGGALYEKNSEIFRRYNLAVHLDAFNTMSDYEIKKRFCRGSDLTLSRLKRMAACNSIRSLEEDNSDGLEFGDLIEDFRYFDADKILSYMVKKDFISLLEGVDATICELFAAGFSAKEIGAVFKLSDGTCRDNISRIYGRASYYGVSRDLHKIYTQKPKIPVIKSVGEFERWLDNDSELRFFYMKLTTLQKHIFLHSFILGRRDKDIPQLEGFKLKASTDAYRQKRLIAKKAADYGVDLNYYSERRLREKVVYKELPFVDPRNKSAVFKVRMYLYERLGDASYNMEHFLFGAPAFYVLPLYYFLCSDFSFEKACVLGGAMGNGRSANLIAFAKTLGITIVKNKRGVINTLKRLEEERIKERLILSMIKRNKCTTEIYSDFVVGEKIIPDSFFMSSGKVSSVKLRDILTHKYSPDIINKSLREVKYYLNYYEVEIPAFLRAVNDTYSPCMIEAHQTEAINRNWKLLLHWLPAAVRDDDFEL